MSNQRQIRGDTATNLAASVPAAKELAAFGVTVNAISPNAATRMTATIPQDRIESLTGPIHRFADPSEIAAAVCFLASEEAGYITGVTLPVDGGVTL